MDKLIITKIERHKTGKERKHLLVSNEIFSAVKKIADATDRSVYDVAQIMLQFALDNTDIRDTD